MHRLCLSVLVLNLIATGALWAQDCSRADTNVEMRRLMGGSENICQTYAGKVVLAVNVASRCGFTPQYEALEQVWQRYRERGLVVIGFPSDDFGGQELGEDREIAEFCKLNYGVSFPMFGKSGVKGEQANPLYQNLIARTGRAPGWNFNKYLIGRDGMAMAHFSSGVKPDSRELISAIEAALGDSEQVSSR